MTFHQRAVLAMAMLGVLALGAPARATVAKCQQAVSKASAAYEQARVKLLGTCEQAKIKGKLPSTTTCATEPDTLAKLNAASAKLRKNLATACGGKDKTCGVDPDNSEDFASEIGFPSSCHDLDAAGCDGAIVHCGDIATCLECVADHAADSANELFHASLTPGTKNDKALNKCQQTISKEAAKFLQAKAKALQTCGDLRLKGKHSNGCPDAGAPAKSPARKAFDTIASADAVRTEKICKACGGTDKTCGGAQDLSIAAIGFATSCPDVDVPSSGESCAAIGGVASVAELGQCVGCVTDHFVECVDRGAVPTLSAYPEECSPAPPTPSCTSAQVTVVTSFTPQPNPDFVAGISVSVDYPGAKLEIPGSGTASSVTARVTNLTGVSGSLTSAADLNTDADAFDDRLNVGMVNASDALPPGNFVRITFDCRAATPGPTVAAFGCSSNVATLEGGIIASSCQVTNLVTTP